LVLDATTGQNGIHQAKAFNEVTKLTGIILTKMDGTSKGGIILSIKDAFNLPIKYIGLGESIEDLEPFDLEMFIHGLINELKI
jgi:fused signal recognition particle receptor